MRDQFYKLMLVTHRQSTPLSKYLHFIEQCLASGAGITCVQLREKNAPFTALFELASELKVLLSTYQIPLIINDNIELALAVDAEGVHLGQTDGSPQQARERLGADKLIGLSIETEDELQQANHCQLSYVAASAVFATKHKNNLRRLWGIEGLRDLANRSVHPMVAIGGINQSNVHEVIAAGAQGIAVIGALHEAENAAHMALKLRNLLEGKK